MKTHLDFDLDHWTSADAKIIGAFQKKDGKSAQVAASDKELVKEFENINSSASFTASAGSTFQFTSTAGDNIIIVGMGEKSKAKAEGIRKAVAHGVNAVKGEKFKNVAIDVNSFNAINKTADTLGLINESVKLSTYSFSKYLEKAPKNSFKEVHLYVSDKKIKRTADKILEKSKNTAESVNFARDLVNEPPNVLHSEEYSKRIEADVKTAMKGKGVKVKVMGKTELKKEKMNLFLSVNAGSAKQPQLVHLTYTPKKTTKNTKHYCLVGKGLTFDTGGYSLKPGGSMMGMKFDMGGSSTVYGAFRAAVLNNSPYKITCILGMTDNMVNEHATVPDSIVKGRSGTTVEILNTDAEGRLVLADCLDYACDQKPDYIIDAATLTGACLVALGSQVCAVLGNDDKFTKTVLKAAKDQDEYMWELPIIPEWRSDMKSKIADLKNIGTASRAGTATAAAFLEYFIKNDIKWAHLDIAGVCDSQTHLPYCPSKGGSGLIVRSLERLLSDK